MATEAKQLSFREVLALRHVRQLWIAQIISIFGDFLALFAVLSDVSFRLRASAINFSHAMSSPPSEKQ
jgi:hypothetical protein